MVFTPWVMTSHIHIPWRSGRTTLDSLVPPPHFLLKNRVVFFKPCRIFHKPYHFFGHYDMGYSCLDWMTSKTRPRSRILAPAQRAAGDCPPPKAIPDREPAARRIFFWISMFSIQKLMIFRYNNGFKTCLVPVPINYYDKLSIIGSSVNVLFLSFWCWYQCFIFLFLTVPIIYYDRNLS